MLTRGQVQKRFENHDMLPEVHSILTESVLLHIQPDSREASLFLTKIQEAMFWAIAQNQ